MKRATLLSMLLAALACPAGAQGVPKGRFIEKSTYLDGGVGKRPPTEHTHEMKGPAREVILHLVFRKGLFRLSKTGNGRGVFAGVYIEVNDADQPTDPIKNPFRPVAVQRAKNADWVDFVANDFPYPNPEPGYWYTWGRTMEELERPLRLDMGVRARYRIHIRGVLDDRRDETRVPTLVGITELDGAAAEEQAGPAPVPSKEEATRPVLGRLEFAFPSGKRETSLLYLEREAPVSVRPGEKFKYLIRVTNLTDKPVETIAVVEEGAGRIELVRSDPAFGRADEDVIVWRLGTIAPRGMKEITVEAVAQDRAGVQRSCYLRWESPMITQKIAVVR